VPFCHVTCSSTVSWTSGGDCGSLVAAGGIPSGDGAGDVRVGAGRVGAGVVDGGGGDGCLGAGGGCSLNPGSSAGCAIASAGKHNINMGRAIRRNVRFIVSSLTLAFSSVADCMRTLVTLSICAYSRPMPTHDIESLLTEKRVFPPPGEFAAKSCAKSMAED